MSSGFVPAGTILTSTSSPKVATSAEDDAWSAARAAVAGTTHTTTSTSTASRTTAPPEDTRSLFEILQANKARKQEEFEEKLKFKNQFRPLDEGDVEFLV
jgi:predicted DNA-binding transcriptional regulator YafY